MKNIRVVSILKPGQDPSLPSSYRPTSLLDTVVKLFEKILLARVLRGLSERGLLRDEQFRFRPRHSTTLQLAGFVDTVNRNFDERWLTGAVFQDVVKAFDTVWVNGLLYNLTVLNFPSYLVKCERHTHTLPPCLVSAVCGRHGSSSHVPQSIASRRLSGGLSR
jgi:hypothetical protein